MYYKLVLGSEPDISDEITHLLNILIIFGHNEKLKWPINRIIDCKFGAAFLKTTLHQHQIHSVCCFVCDKHRQLNALNVLCFKPFACEHIFHLSISIKNSLHITIYLVRHKCSTENVQNTNKLRRNAQFHTHSVYFTLIVKAISLSISLIRIYEFIKIEK